MTPFKINQFQSLTEAVKKYGISNSRMIEINKKIQKFEEGEGLDVDFSDIFSTNKDELFTILNGSIRKSIIHIVDISNWRENWGLPRFHIYSCEKIEEMKSKSRSHRYKMSGKTDGTFYLITKKNKAVYKSLEICSFCLNSYNNQFKTKKTKKNFLLKEYLEKSFIHKKFTNVELDICTVPNTYVASWSKISKKLKEQANHMCSQCFSDLSSKNLKKFLHAHHMDANKRNNIKENLKVLCIECHAKQDQHSHIKNHISYKLYMKEKVS